MTTASELEQLHKKFDKLKVEDSKAKGGMDAVMGQLNKYGIKNLDEAEIFISGAIKDKDTKIKKRNKIVEKIKTLLEK